MVRKCSRAGRVASAGALAALLAASAGAAAEPTAQDRGLAEALFRDAKALLDQGKTEEACAKLEESQRIDPKPGTMLNLAVCRERQGRPASAWADYLEAAGLCARAGQKERERFARERAAALEKDLARLTLVVEKAAPGMTLRLDGRAVGEAAWGTPAPVDPGEHELEAAAPGRAAWSQKVTIEPGPGAKAVTVPELVPAKAAAKPPPSPGPLAASARPKAASPDKRSGRVPAQAIAGYAVGGAVGVAGIVVGSVFGARTFAKKAEGDGYCNRYGFCDAAGLELYRSAERAALVSTIGFGVGIAGLGAGLALVLTAKRTEAPRQAWVLPSGGPSGGGISAGFRF